MFDRLYDDFSITWSNAYLEYFNVELKPSVLNNSGRWLLEPRNMYHPFSGITNNVQKV